EGDITNLVDIAWISTPNVVGQDALLALDQSGIIMYCLPDGSSPVTARLSPPTNGWGAPRAVEVFADRLYVLDPPVNQVWVFERIGGLFSEPPSPYFSEAVYDLSTIVDFAIAQGDLYLLRTDSSMMQCTRNTFDNTNCTERVTYIDERIGRSAADRLADLSAPASLVFDPPPEPSLYIADADSAGAYQLSLGMVLQRQFRPTAGLGTPVNAVAIGSGKEIYYAAGNNVYVGARP
ncbi:MAG: hypothetical protein ACE5FI_18240, partial [Anaerolineales bacterium]